MKATSMARKASSAFDFVQKFGNLVTFKSNNGFFVNLKETNGQLGRFFTRAPFFYSSFLFFSARVVMILMTRAG